MRTSLPIQGNFEITAAFQILEAETPTDGFGVGVTLYLQKVPPRDEGATLCRFVRAKDKQILFWDRSIVRPGEETKFDGGSAPCTARDFCLRLKRTGTTLRYQWAPGTEGEDFQEIHKLDFGDEEVSRENHATVTFDGRHRRYYVLPGQGRNLVYVNDQPVMTPLELTGGEEILLGQTKLRFVPFCSKSFDWYQK